MGGLKSKAEGREGKSGRERQRNTEEEGRGEGRRKKKEEEKKKFPMDSFGA